jgi:hypothetical protein
VNVGIAEAANGLYIAPLFGLGRPFVTVQSLSNYIQAISEGRTYLDSLLTLTRFTGETILSQFGGKNSACLDFLDFVVVELELSCSLRFGVGESAILAALASTASRILCRCVFRTSTTDYPAKEVSEKRVIQ